MNKCAWDIKIRYPNSRGGWYDIDGTNIWCDMSTDGGGWMLVANVTLDGLHGTRGTLGNKVDGNLVASAKYDDDFINELRANSSYTGLTPWRAICDNFDVFPGNSDIVVPDRLASQTQFINKEMIEFNAELPALKTIGATYMHITYEHGVCMKIKTTNKALGFGDNYRSGDTYFAWQHADHPKGFYADWRGKGTGTFWVK